MRLKLAREEVLLQLVFEPVYPGVGGGVLELGYLQWILGALLSLILGSYTYTYLTIRDLARKFDRLTSNHLKSLDARVRTIEAWIRLRKKA